MTYSSGGLIQVTDYNFRVNSVNTLLGTGSGDTGYGQTTISTNNVGDIVTATQWATLISKLQTIQQHQINSTAGIPTSPTFGTTITYLSTVDTAIASLQTNRLVYYATQPLVTANTAVNSTTWSSTATKTWTFTFSSGDAARYFFNSGGRINLNLTGTSLSGTTKSTYWNSFLTSGFNNWDVGARTSSHYGTGYQRSIYLSTSGYYNLTTTPTTWLSLADNPSLADYTLNTAVIQLSSNGPQGANGDRGNIITLSLILTDNATDTFDDTIIGSISAAAIIYYPETTYLSNSWGAITTVNTVDTQV
jgi:hypothetical protein